MCVNRRTERRVCPPKRCSAARLLLHGAGVVLCELCHLRRYSLDGTVYVGNNGYNSNPQSVWFTLALNAPDQLRQRVAWALSQIFVVGAGMDTFQSEPWHTYYDIFVRNAFGSYRDVLREVARFFQLG